MDKSQKHYRTSVWAISCLLMACLTILYVYVGVRIKRQPSAQKTCLYVVWLLFLLGTLFGFIQFVYELKNEQYVTYDDEYQTSVGLTFIKTLR